MSRNDAAAATATQMLRAENAHLKGQHVNLLRLVEHMRCVQAIMLKRLGGYIAIHDAALVRSVQDFDVEMGTRTGLALPDDSGAVPKPEKGPMTFRLIDRHTQSQVEAKLKALPQRVIDLLEAAEAVETDPDGIDNLRVVAKALREHVLQTDHEDQ